MCVCVLVLWVLFLQCVVFFFVTVSYLLWRFSMVNFRICVFVIDRVVLCLGFVFSNINYTVTSLLRTVSLINFCICVFCHCVIVVLFMCLCFVYSTSKYHRLQLVANSLTGELLPRHLLVLASIQPAQDPVSPVLKVLLNKQNSCLLKASKYSKYCRRVAKKIRNSLNSR